MSAINFDKLLLDNAEFLKPFAATLTHDNETAKDLIQETMLRALYNKEKYNIGTNIKAWLYTIMRNIFINDYRRKIRQSTIFDHSAEGFLLSQQQTTTLNYAVDNLGLKETYTYIHQLPDIFKHPFILNFEGYKYHEIAFMLKEPLGTIKSRIHFARKLLKAQIER